MDDVAISGETVKHHFQFVVRRHRRHTESEFRRKTRLKLVTLLLQVCQRGSILRNLVLVRSAATVLAVGRSRCQPGSRHANWRLARGGARSGLGGRRRTGGCRGCHWWLSSWKGVRNTADQGRRAVSDSAGLSVGDVLDVALRRMEIEVSGISSERATEDRRPQYRCTCSSSVSGCASAMPCSTSPDAVLDVVHQSGLLVVTSARTWWA
jgi:hypothetical protein